MTDLRRPWSYGPRLGRDGQTIQSHFNWPGRARRHESQACTACLPEATGAADSAGNACPGAPSCRGWVFKLCKEFEVSSLWSSIKPGIERKYARKASTTLGPDCVVKRSAEVLGRTKGLNKAGSLEAIAHEATKTTKCVACNKNLQSEQVSQQVASCCTHQIMQLRYMPDVRRDSTEQG